MKPDRRLDDRGSLLVVIAFVVLALLGHVCAVQTSAEGQPTAGSDAHGASDPHHEAGGSHIASCDTGTSHVPPACPDPTPAAGAVVGTTHASVDAALGHPGAHHSLVAQRRSPDRSIFLLNAVLLI